MRLLTMVDAPPPRQPLLLLCAEDGVRRGDAECRSVEDQIADTTGIAISGHRRLVAGEKRLLRVLECRCIGHRSEVVDNDCMPSLDVDGMTERPRPEHPASWKCLHEFRRAEPLLLDWYR